MNETLVPRLKFNSDGHVPAVIQDAKSLKVLTLCYMNQAAIEKTVAEGFVYVYRRSLGMLMLKGETSGHTQKVRSIRIDCEGKSMLIQVEQKVAACHQGYFTCYFEELQPSGFAVTEKKAFEPDNVYKKGH